MLYQHMIDSHKVTVRLKNIVPFETNYIIIFLSNHLLQLEKFLKYSLRKINETTFSKHIDLFI